MILGKETSTWPLQSDRPDLAATWFDHLRVQTREVLDAMESIAYSGVDSKLTVPELVESIDGMRMRAHFNRSLATAMLAKRERLGLPVTPAAGATIRDVIEDLHRLVDQADAIAFFFEGVAKDASFYKTLKK